MLNITFADNQLSLVETDEAGSTKLQVPVIKSARRKLAIIRSLTDVSQLRTWKSLHYEKLKGNYEGKRSIRLNDQYRLIFELNKETVPHTIVVLEIKDYHS